MVSVIDLDTGRMVEAPDSVIQPQNEDTKDLGAGKIIDLETGTLVDPPFNEPDQPGLPQPDFPGAAIIEPALTMASGALAEPIAGLAGIAQTLNPFAEPGAGAEAVRSTRAALTRQPRTEAGRGGLKAVGEALEPVGRAISSAEDITGDVGFALGGPLGGAIGKSIPTALMEALGLGATSKVTRRAGGLIDKTGAPTKKLSDALKESGTKFSDLSEDAVKALSSDSFTDPAQQIRAERFKSLGIPATTGDITGKFKDQAVEARLLESAADDSAAPIRALRLKQSQGLEAKLNDMVDNLGVSGDVGDSLKDALSGRKKALKAEKNALYKAVAESSPEIQDLPLFTDSIMEALPSDAEIRRLGRIKGSQVEAMKDLMVEFGIDTSADAVEKFIESGGEVIPLTLGNFDEFRQAIGQLERADTTGATSVIGSKVREALDAEADIVDSSVRAADITDPGVLDTLKQARKTVRTLKTEFSPESITGRLTGKRKDRVTPVVEASKVFNELLGANKAPELLERTIESLSKSGPKGKKALGDMQAAAVMKLLDDSFKAQTRTISGQKVIGGTAFQNSLRNLNQGGKMDKLFKSNPDAYAKIKEIGEALRDITPPSGAMPKGSAGVLLDTLNKLGLFTITNKIPGVGPFAQAIRLVAEKGTDRAAIDKALKGRPDIDAAYKFIQRDLPEMAAALGVTPIKETNQEDEN